MRNAVSVPVTVHFINTFNKTPSQHNLFIIYNI